MFSNHSSKSVFLLLTALSLNNIACQNENPWHQPGATPTYKITIGVENCTGANPDSELVEIQNKLTEKLEAAHVFYQNIEVNAEKGELTFHIIGHEDAESDEDFDEILLKEVDIKLVTAIHLADHNTKPWIDTIVQRENLSGIFEPNYIPPGAVFGKLGGLAVLGGFKKENTESIIAAFSKYEEELPFSVFIGKNSSNYVDIEMFLCGVLRSDEIMVSNKDITRARISPGPDGSIEVVIGMSIEGAEKFRIMTTEAANDKNREILILLNDEVVSAPRVNEPIIGGSAAISGFFSLKQAELISTLINIGQLPCDIKVLKKGRIN